MTPRRLRCFALILGLLAGATGCVTTPASYEEAQVFAAQGQCEQALHRLTGVGAFPEDEAANGLSVSIEQGILVGRGVDGGGAADSLADRVPWQEADLTPLIVAMRRLAACYEARGDKGSLITAFAQLREIIESPLYGQTAEGEQQHVDSQLERVEAELRGVDPEYNVALEAHHRQLDAAKARPVYAH